MIAVPDQVIIQLGPNFVNWFVIADPWRRHQMEIFSALLAICAGN